VSAEQLLADFESRGVTFHRKGTRIHYRAPAGVLSRQDFEAIRAVKVHLLSLVLPESLPSEPSPFDQFMTEWQATAGRVHAAFIRNGVQPNHETWQAATWLAFQIDEGWPGIFISKVDAKGHLTAILQGRCVARIGDDALVVIRAAEPSGARITT
jgi:hypothetical protein